jgi:cell division protein FtsB
MSAKRLTIIVVILIIGVLIYMFAPGFSKLRLLLAKKADLMRKIKSLETSNLRLETEEKRLENDPVYIEKLTRQKLGVSKPGEVIYRVVPQEE